jgi:hypothetical protein
MRASKLWVGLLLWCLMAWMVPGVHAAPEEEGATPATEQKGNLAEELDNGHKNPGPGLEEPQEVRFDLSIYTFVVFALLMLLLWKFAWGPIAAGLDIVQETQFVAMRSLSTRRTQWCGRRDVPLR